MIHQVNCNAGYGIHVSAALVEYPQPIHLLVNPNPMPITTNDLSIDIFLYSCMLGRRGLLNFPESDALTEVKGKGYGV
jgi:hypothetical protein